MSNLSFFMKQNALPLENLRYAPSLRYLDEAGQPVEWEIRSISTEEDEVLRKECTKRVQVPGKRGQYTLDTDYNLYLKKLASRCTVFPNLRDVELQNSYGVMGEEALLQALLVMPAEYANYLAKVQEVNGFTTFEEQVDEAKN